MRPNRLTRLIAPLALLSCTLLAPGAARADDDTLAEDEYEERARVVRVSLTKGEVSLKRAGEVEWELARLNVPVVEGDALATGPGARLELQLDARNFIRVGPDSVLRVVTLRDEGVAFSLSEGTATFRLARFEREREYFEVDAPGTTVAAEQRGLYRLDVTRAGDVTVTVRDDGRARVYSQTSGFVLRNNRTARLAAGGVEEGDWELSAAAPFDGWDQWNEERERHLAARLRLEGRERYYDPEVWGAEELDLYGDWVETREYGYVWRPHTTVINHYSDWAPYRYGHWRYCPPYGWTWIPDEDWGWAPYHYGRWVYVNNYWCWAPRGYGYRYRRAWWRPALVAFVFIPTSRGEHIAWYPLRHGQRDPRGRFWPRGYGRLSPLGRRDRDHLRRADPLLLRAVTAVAAREFGVESVRGRAAAADIARRALNGEPVRGQLPISPQDRPRADAPSNAGGRVLGAPADRPTGASTSAARGGLVISRPAPIGPARTLPERPTGAAARTPGAPLDNELRRTRVFGGRQPRPSAAPSEGGAAQGEANTGAVLRPTRPSRRPGLDNGGGLVGGGAAPRGGEPDAAPSPRVRPGGDGEGGGNDSLKSRERPARPSWRDRPVIERPASPEARPEPRPSAPAERPQPRREMPPAPRPERAAPSESRPRSEPRQEAPRQEAPRQSAPRQEEPRQERQAPPPRESRPAAPARPSTKTRDQD